MCNLLGPTIYYIYILLVGLTTYHFESYQIVARLVATKDEEMWHLAAN